MRDGDVVSQANSIDKESADLVEKTHVTSQIQRIPTAIISKMTWPGDMPGNTEIDYQQR